MIENDLESAWSRTCPKSNYAKLDLIERWKEKYKKNTSKLNWNHASCYYNDNPGGEIIPLFIHLNKI